MFVNGLLSATIIYVQMQIKVNKKYLLIKLHCIYLLLVTIEKQALFKIYFTFLNFVCRYSVMTTQS